jgi:4-amino-4-deoxy-L-arabinose transferase-like glycosyltransferase
MSRRKPALSPGPDRHQWNPDPYLAVLLALAAVFRMPRLTESLWYDEVCYTSVFLQSELQYKMIFRDVHPPLYTLFMKGWIGLFGDGELAVRMPSLLFGLVSVWVVFKLSREWFGRRPALLATALMVISPVHIWYSQEVKNNMLLLLLSLGTVYWLQRAWRENRRQSWAWFVVLALASLWTNLFAVWVIAALFLWLAIQLLRDSTGSRRRPALASGAAVVLGWLPFVWLALSHSGLLRRDYLRALSGADLYSLFLVYLSHGNTLRTISPYDPVQSLRTQSSAWFLLDAFFLFLLCAGLRAWWCAGRLRPSGAGGAPLPDRPSSELLFLYLLLPPLAVMAGSLIYRNAYIERSMIILLPPFLMALACGVDAFRSPAWKRGLAVTLFVLNGWALYNLWVAKADVWTVYKPNPDWRSAASYLAEEARHSSRPVFIVEHAQGEALEYHYRRLLTAMRPERRRAYPLKLPHGRMVEYDEDKFGDFLAQFSVGTVYVIHDLTWGEGFEALERGIRSSALLLDAGKTAFKGLEIHRFRVQGRSGGP